MYKNLNLILAGVLLSSTLVHAAPNPERNVYFGDLHLHTAYSFDAYIMMGTKNTPDLAYKFARGETIDYLGHPVKRAWPLDFLAVTDHSENIGVFAVMPGMKARPIVTATANRPGRRNCSSSCDVDACRHAMSGPTPVSSNSTNPIGAIHRL